MEGSRAFVVAEEKQQRSGWAAAWSMGRRPSAATEKVTPHLASWFNPRSVLSASGPTFQLQPPPCAGHPQVTLSWMGTVGAHRKAQLRV